MKFVTGQNSRSSSCWEQEEEAEGGASDSTVSQELLWLWERESSWTQQEERPPLEAGTRGIVKESRPRELGVCSELQTDCVWNSNSAIDCNC